MSKPRNAFGAVTLPDGRILAIGGVGLTPATSGQVEAYDPATNVWTAEAPLSSVREYFGAALGSDGRVYAVGGQTGDAPATSMTASVTAYDPAANTWSPVASLPNPTTHLGVAAGPDGHIYAMGGETYSSACTCVVPTAAVESYDPATDTWTAVASLPQPRLDFATVLGADGKIYAIGGDVVDSSCSCEYTTASVEVYDPRANTWSSGVPLPAPRDQFAAVTAPDGSIYVVGDGPTTTGGTIFDAYDPSNHTWSSRAPVLTDSMASPALAASGGKIYMLGGNDISSEYDRSVEEYDPSTNRWIGITPMPNGMQSMATMEAADGRIIVAGDEENALNGVQGYDPRSNTWAQLPPLPVSVDKSAGTTGPGGRLYVMDSWDDTMTLLIYDPVSQSWSTVPAPSSLLPSVEFMAVGPDGNIYIFGGYNVVEVYDPSSGAWAAGPAMPTPRSGASGVIGPDGLIYTFGGLASGPYSPTAVEAYNPLTRQWICSQGDTAPGCSSTSLAPMPNAHLQGQAALGPDSRLYVIGGKNTGGNQGSLVDAYSPVSNTWTTVSSPTGHMFFGAVAGGDGKVYLMGGMGGPQPTGSSLVEGYTPPPYLSLTTQPAPGPGAVSVTVTAHGVTGAPDPTYTGTVHFTSTDSAASLPADYTFTPADAGSHTFSIKLATAGQQTISVTDTAADLTPAIYSLDVISTAIASGWTLLDVPLAGTSIRSLSQVAGSINASLGASAVSLTATYANGRYELYVPGYSQNVPITPATGIFVKSTAAGTWTLAAQREALSQPMELDPGWNLIAAPYPAIGLDDTIVENEVGAACGLQAIGTYGSTGYRVWTPTSGSHVYMPPTSGFWLECSKGTTWMPS